MNEQETQGTTSTGSPPSPSAVFGGGRCWRNFLAA
jgi:hypothetical protein